MRATLSAQTKVEMANILASACEIKYGNNKETMLA